MLLLNFTHPLSAEQLAAAEVLAGRAIERVINAPAAFDHARPFAEQVGALVDSVGLSPDEWQTTPLLVNPPALATITATLLAELHGRMGYFPTMLRVRPVAGSTPPVYEVAEVINLQAVRDAARTRR